MLKYSENALELSPTHSQTNKMAAHQRIRQRRAVLRRPIVFLDRNNPLEVYEEDVIFSRFRFRPATIMYIVGLLPEIAFNTQRNCSLPPLIQVLITLRFLATGAIHQLIGDYMGVARSTAQRTIIRVTQHLTQLAGTYIQFPVGEVANEVKYGFSKIAGFPNTLGCIDGTQIRIQKPTENEKDYVNRKNYHSLNVQMCCDHKFYITSCYAGWPGSVHDSRVFRSSAMCRQFENGTHDGLLLGDSGYACRQYLMTPFLNPDTPPKVRYNDALCRTRVTIEQTFGLLKRRFQVLHVEQRCTPDHAVANIMASVVLHNIGILRGDILNIDILEVENDDYQAPVGVVDGNAYRNHLLQTYFT